MTRLYEKYFFVRQNLEHIEIKMLYVSICTLYIYMNQEDTICVLASLCMSHPGKHLYSSKSTVSASMTSWRASTNATFQIY
jgi:hypothetical protein